MTQSPIPNASDGGGNPIMEEMTTCKMPVW